MAEANGAFESTANASLQHGTVCREAPLDASLGPKLANTIPDVIIDLTHPTITYELRADCILINATSILEGKHIKVDIHDDLILLKDKSYHQLRLYLSDEMKELDTTEELNAVPFEESRTFYVSTEYDLRDPGNFQDMDHGCVSTVVFWFWKKEVLVNRRKQEAEMARILKNAMAQMDTMKTLTSM